MLWNDFSSCVSRLPIKDQNLIQKAFELGKEAHKGQKRRSGEPYFIHPIAVAKIIADIGGDADAIIAALLHDAVEDTSITLEEIEKEFCIHVKKIIDGMTKLSQEDEKLMPQHDEQIETIRKIFTLMQEDVRIMVIKIADRLHNMQTIEFLSPERQITLAEETLHVYVKIADRLCLRILRDSLEELCIKVLEPKLHSDLLLLREKNEKNGIKTMKNIENVLKDFNPKLSKEISLNYENKSWGRLRTQLKSEGAAITGVTALTYSFVCKDIPTCYEILGALHSNWQRETLSFEDFINGPMINGYQGLHTSIIMENGVRIRCKIRTDEMDIYAHNGIITKCFDSEATGILDYLPWTKRIATLSADTADRSEQFWTSLQSDILGDSITVHGPNDRALSLPKGSTALDGAFYLFGKKAFNVKSIKVDGNEVPFSTPIKHAVTIDISVSNKSDVSREWLSWVHTGYAIAKIREKLSNRSENQKIQAGKQLLKETLTSKGKGFIEEISKERINSALSSIGFSNLRETYIAIANGHIETEILYDELFKKPLADFKGGNTHIVQFSFSVTDINLITKLVRSFQKHKKQCKKTRIRYNPFTGNVTIIMSILFSQQEWHAYLAEIKSIGIKKYTILHNNQAKVNFFFGVAILLILWGFDPAIGRYLIQKYNATPIDMTLIRFWSLTILSAIFLLLRYRKKDIQEAPLNLKNFSLWISVLLLTAISLTTYTALITTDPSHYTIPMTIGGVLLTSMVNRKHKALLLVTWLFLFSGIALLITYSTSWPIQGIIMTLLAVISFAAFSLVSEKYKKQENVQSRSAQYFFILSISCAVLAIPLIPFNTILNYSGSIILQLIAFSIFFAGLPYYIYYYLLSHKQIDFVLRYSFLIIFSTVIGQYLILNDVKWSIVLPSGILVIIGAMLPLLMIKKKS